MKILSDRIKELRNEKQISQEELAKAVEVTDGAISTWENNKNEPKATQIVKLCDYFNVCADYLLGRQDWY